MNNFPIQRPGGVRRTLLAALVAACCGTAGGTPTLPQVVAGQATFAQQGNVFSITNTPNTIINWQSFSVNAGEVTRFIQQNANSAVLNRITGQDPSKILGALQSNGQVFLINPNGILFGRDARVDVHGLTASTLELNNTDFLAGKRQFTAGGKAGSVSNEGRISTPSGGQVFLVAPQVDNSGVITAPNGQVVLAAGHSVTLVDSGNPDLHVVVSAPGDQAVNLGQVISQGGQVGIYGALVRQKGLVSADSAMMGANGKIVFKASGETVLDAGSVTTATGAGKGGEVQVLGRQVALAGDARIDASGAHGGGTVLVGGDYRGKNPALQKAQQTTVGKDVLIRADALDKGDGGKIVLWSDGITRAQGSLSARGGSKGGNGGLIETSGRALDTAGVRIDAGAAKGKLGRWLLDPTDIEVVAVANPSRTDGVSEVLTATLDGATADVLIEADQTIYFSSPTTIGGGKSITATAIDITVNAAVATTGSGTITINAGVGGCDCTGLMVGVNGSLTTAGGAINLNGAGVDIAGSINAGSGYVKFNVPTGAATIESGATLTANGLAVDAGSWTLGPTLAVSKVAANITSGGFNIFSSLPLTVGTVGGISGITSTDIVEVQAPGISGGTITAPYARLYSSGGIGSAGAPFQTHVDYLKVGNTSANDPIHVDNAIALEIGAADQNSGGGIYITSHGGLSLLAPDGPNSVNSAGGPIVLRTYSPMTIDGVIDSGGGAVTLDAPGGAISLSTYALVTTGTGSLSVSADTLNNAGTLSTTTGAISVSAATLNNTGAIQSSTGNINIATDTTPLGGSITTSGQKVVSALTAPPPPATVSDCVATPATAECSALLKRTFDACLLDPSGVDCKLVLPSLSTCTTAPATAGCAVVLPPLDKCIAAPATAGCSAVLPTLTACIASPATAGCSVVLPTLTQCIATPAQAGCSVVLPTLTACIAAPSTAGCSVVLPTLTACIAAPSTAGCSVVLPTITACIAAPTQAGCSVVLPTLSACIAAPATPGCVVVLPTLTQCIATPAQAGCSVVLPTITACIATPTQAGCSVVLPTLSACIAAPVTPGCSVVLPSLASCTASPTLAGCSVVLPTLAQCAASPTLQGCTAVLPSPSLCDITPTAPSCVLVTTPPLAPPDSPVFQTINTSIDIINTTAPVLLPAAFPATVLNPPAGQAGGGGASSGSAGKATDDVKKDDKKDQLAATDKTGVKNEPAKKMYCN